MKMLWRICLIALLVLQVNAQPLHAFSQETQHLAAGDGHHHTHTHTNDLASIHTDDVQANLNTSSSMSDLAIDSDEHTCISHCHVLAALLGSSTLFGATPSRFTAVSEYFDLALNIPGSIDRPKWVAARV